MKTKFSAGEFRKLTGISAETLRHYIDCSIIDSFDVAPNNYKMYSVKNAVDVLHARMCRGLDLGLPQIVHKAEFAFKEQEALLLRHEAALQAEITDLDLKLGRLRQQIEYLASSRELLGQVKERTAKEVPPIYRLMLIGEGISMSANSSKIVEQWMTHPQFTHVALVVPRAALLDPQLDDLPVRIGIGVRADFSSLLKLDTCPPAVYVPNEQNIGTLIPVSDPFNLKRKDVRILLEEAKRLGREITSDLFGRLCTALDTDRGRIYYFSLSVCIK